MNQAYKHLKPIKAPKKGRGWAGREKSLTVTHTLLPQKGSAALLSEAPLGQSQPAQTTTGHPDARGAQAPKDTACLCPRDDARVPARRPARFTAQSSKPARRLPGHRNVIVWLPVKGPVYWKHTSFPMFGFLSLFSPFCFSQSAPPRPFGKGTELKILP